MVIAAAAMQASTVQVAVAQAGVPLPREVTTLLRMPRPSEAL